MAPVVTRIVIIGGGPAGYEAALVAALDRHEGNVSRAARYLRIGRQKLIYRMRKYGIR